MLGKRNAIHTRYETCLSSIVSTSIPSALSIAPGGPGWPFPGLGPCASGESAAPDGKNVGVDGSDSRARGSCMGLVEGVDRAIRNNPRRPDVKGGERIE